LRPRDARAAILPAERLPQMPHLARRALAGAALISSLALTACGEDEPKPDPAVIDQHLNKLIRDDEANKNRLREEARDREDLREHEMKQREANYAADDASVERNAVVNTAD
jgi:hypothetical protein